LQSGGTFTGDIELNDNVKASFGDDQDFEIYHSGSASIVREASSGNLVLAGNDVNITNGAMNQTHIDCNNGGSVELYHNNNFKFSTLTDGARIVGNLTISGNVDGRDVATDGTKLDGISAGAEVNVQADYNATSGDAQILNKPSLSTVATSGSYNDLSNKPTIPTNNNQLTNGAGYITSFTNTTYSAGTGLSLSGTTFNNTITNNNQLTNGAGYVTTDTNTTYSGGTGITISGTTINRDSMSSGDVGLSSLSSNGNSLSGSFTASGNITAFSSKKLKSNIETIDNALDKVSQMRGVTFTKDNEKGSGVIAEELEEVAPELVLDGEYKSVAYGNTVGYLIEAIKELKNEVRELKTKLCECKD
jgi:hypothetical protein